MEQWTLDYDESLFLRTADDTEGDFSSTAFYKIYLRRYAYAYQDRIVRFKKGLTYLDYKRIIHLCQAQCDKQKSALTVSDALSDYINSREIYIEKRSRLGIEIKEENSKLNEEFDEYKRIVDDGMSRKLRDKQMVDSFFMCAMQRSANFSVPGSGKTASVLGVYAFLKEKKLAKRIVVICPKNAFGSWIDEFNACFQSIESLRVFNVHDAKYKNSKEKNRALQFDSGKSNLILVNYESLGSYERTLEEIIDKETILVYDEVHRVKRVNGEYASHAVNISKNGVYIIVMTGTPIPNGYVDIYNFLHILFMDEYNEFFGFEGTMLKNPQPNEVQIINEKIQPFFCRTTKEELGVPPANADRIIPTIADNTENKIFHILKMRYRKNKLALMIRILQLESNPKLLLRSLDLSEFSYLLEDSAPTKEIDYADYSEDIKKMIRDCSDSSKFDAMLDNAKKITATGKTLIIWCIFIDSIKRISKALEDNGISTRCIYGEVPLDERAKIINDFKSGATQVLITNPHTLAESVSLHTACHDALYFEYSYNLVHLLQSKDRIHRLGLAQGQYTQYYFMQMDYETEDGPWSLDQQIYARLKEKEQIMYDAIARQNLEIMPTSNEDLDIIFSKLRFRQ